jgi:hypothetical protein
MPLVASASSAVVFGAQYDQFEVAFSADVPRDGLGKAWPSGAAFVFMLTFE